MATQSEMRTAAPARMYRALAQIVRATDITPRMRRITLSGEGLRPVVAGRLPADAVKLYLPEPGKPGFMPQFPMLPSRDNRYSVRAYTIRRFDADKLELDIDVVLHGDSPGSIWARTVQPGEQVGFVGPRHEFRPPTDTNWYVFAGDETALPAIAAMLESLPAGTYAHAFIEAANASDEIPLDTPAHAEVNWLHRGALHAEQSDLLEQAVRSLPWQAGKVYAWAAGETSVVRAIRGYLQYERHVERNAMHMSGYWRAEPLNPLHSMRALFNTTRAALTGRRSEDNLHDVEE